MKKEIIITLIVLGVSFAYPQKVSIPFTINEKKRIILDYNIKGRKVKLMFDTGASMNFIDIKVANEINFIPNREQNTNTYSTFGDLKYDVIMPKGFNKGDSIFNSFWMLTDITKTRNLLDLGDDVDGMVGFDWKNFNNILELNFKDKQLNIWGNIPSEYVKNTTFEKVHLFEADSGHENKASKVFTMPICIQGSLIVVDSIHYHPLFLLDSGTAGYSLIAVYDSLLLTKMITFKKTIKEKFGNNYPTTRLLLPELRIDSLYVNLSVINRSNYKNESAQIFGNYQIGGILGVEFLTKYEKILFDSKKKVCYFFKR